MRSVQDRKSDERNNGDNTPQVLLNALVNILDKQMKQGQEPAGRTDEEAKNNPFEEEKAVPNNNIEEEKVDKRRQMFPIPEELSNQASSQASQMSEQMSLSNFKNEDDEEVKERGGAANPMSMRQFSSNKHPKK